jgi:CHAT domain-containing protein/tetratricopeptide (TPR) repeat protein
LQIGTPTVTIRARSPTNSITHNAGDSSLHFCRFCELQSMIKESQRATDPSRNLNCLERVSMYITKPRGCRLIVTVLLLSTFASAQTLPEVRALEPNKPIERELRGGEIHAYSISLTTGQFLHVTVDQRGVDLVVFLFGPDGKQLMEVDSPNGTQGPEPVAFVARDSGLYRFEVRSLEKTAPAGRYEIRIEALREATTADKTKNLAARLVAVETEEGRAAMLANAPDLVTKELAQTLYEQGVVFINQQYYERAFTSFTLAQKLGEKFGDNKLIAAAFSGIGVVYEAKEQHDKSLEYYLKSLALLESLGDKPKMAHIHGNIATAYRFMGDYAHGLESYQRSLVLYQELGDKSMIARALNGIALSHNLMGNQVLALENYQKSLTVLESTDNKGLTGHTLGLLASTYVVLGRYPQALKSYERGLRLLEELGRDQEVAEFLIDMGGVHHGQGNYAEALNNYRLALRAADSLDDKSTYAEALMGTGDVLRSQGDYTRAAEVFQQSFKLSESFLSSSGLDRMQDRVGVARALNSLGEIQTTQGNYTRALELFQKALPFLEATPVEFVSEETAALLNNIGDAHALQGNYTEAQKYYQKSLTLSERVGMTGGVAHALNHSANAYRLQGDQTRALEAAVRAAALARQIGDRETLWNALATAGDVHRAAGEHALSLQAFEEAIATIESLRANFRGQEARATYFATVRRPYESYIELLMRLHKQNPSGGYDGRALEASERGRARTLLEALTESHADIRQGVEPALLQRERDLQQQLNAAAKRQVKLPSQPVEAGQAAVKKEVDALTAEFQDVQAQIRQRSPRYAALTQPVPLSLREIQANVLDADTLLLEYALGEERSYVWAVTPTSINSFELPKRSEIETDVRRAVSLLSDGKQWTTNDKVESEYAEVAGRLSSMLLDPVASQLKGKRLVIVGDGALQYLPFGALPSPKSNVQIPRSRKPQLAASIPNPLMVEHEFVRLPSASTLAILRRETAGRTRPTKSIAVLADPVFERDDERVTANRTVASGSSTSPSKDANSQSANSRYLLQRAFGLGLQPATDGDGASREILRIPRLPFTRREAEAILATAPASEGMKALDFRASRETAMNPELAQYRIVHFATHGLLNSEHPELSGIVLSLLNEAGEPVDGFLRLHEIYNLNLPADLVVLSACQTGLGKEIRGEGLVGLTRGFMYAGSPRVVASLWKVSDVATAELMKSFYQGMLRQKMRPAAALRAAQMEMWKQKRWQAPFYWAAFELQGEWR